MWQVEVGITRYLTVCNLKKKEFQNPAHLILKWNGLGIDSVFKKYIFQMSFS